MPVPAALIVKPSQMEDAEENFPGKYDLKWMTKIDWQCIYEFHFVWYSLLFATIPDFSKIRLKR